jgi:hypothetical protein
MKIMANPIKIFALFLLSITSYSQKKVTICTQFNPKLINNSFNIYINNKSQGTFERDTCLSVFFFSRKNYSLRVECEGYETFSLHLLADTLNDNYVVNTIINEKVKLLDEVIVKAESRIRQKGDTLVISVSDIETEPHADASQLLENLPEAGYFGGRLSIMGRDIDQIWVDGKLVFGGDIKSTLESLRAEMINNLEIIEKSINGRKVYILNLVLNSDKKKGWYSDSRLNIGTSQRNLFKQNLNRISSKTIFNCFLVQNNIGERVISIEKQDKISEKIFNNTIDGGYSIIEGSERTNKKTLNARDLTRDFTDLSEGLHKNLSGGINFNYNKEKKVDFFGFVIGENLRSNLIKQNNTQTLLGEILQKSSLNEVQNNNTHFISSSLNATFYINTTNTIKVSNNFSLYKGLNNENSFLNSNWTDSKKLNNENSLSHYLQESENNFDYSQKLLWIHRFNRPAKVFSLYINHYQNIENSKSNYQNDYNNFTFGIKNDQKILKTGKNRYLEGQIIFAQPIYRKWLFESRINYLRDNSLLKQNGFLFNNNTILYDKVIDGLSIEHFGVINEQKSLQSFLLHRTPRFRLVLGVIAWSIDFKKNVISSNLDRTNTYQISPRFFSEYRFGQNTRLSASYNQSQITADFRQLFPLPDSSNVASISIGNPFLRFYSPQKSEVLFSNVNLKGNAINIAFKNEIGKNSIINKMEYVDAGLLTNTFTQEGRFINSELKINWSILNRKKDINFMIDNTVGNNKMNSIINNVIYENVSLYNETYISLKWSVWRFLSIRASNQTSLYIQETNILGKQFNLRNDLQVTINSKLKYNYYLELNCKWNVISSNTQQLKPLPIVDINFSKYITKNKNIKMFLATNNLFNVQTNLYNFQNENMLFEQKTNRISQFILFGGSYYFTKWQAK